VDPYAGYTSFNPRHIESDPAKPLSAHARAVAFDINDAQHQPGQRPSPVGTKGSVIELVPILAKYRFYWGGRFSHKDGMHFEYARSS